MTKVANPRHTCRVRRPQVGLCPIHISILNCSRSILMPANLSSQNHKNNTNQIPCFQFITGLNQSNQNPHDFLPRPHAHTPPKQWKVTLTTIKGSTYEFCFPFTTIVAACVLTGVQCGKEFWEIFRLYTWNMEVGLFHYAFVHFVVVDFYRAMHFSAKRGIAIACRLSVCLSVCDVGELWSHNVGILRK